ncbi:phosphohistidine phosphatase SixA [Pseudomonas benzenivorans]|uniref:Phosphohistidine phosphatase SixA n=1 Tax=Pseudomonas benzenivorans TaxID=556533 RepID=A0ABY5H7J4_9PSED|nr:phosphohistidine phosphatase SixA [Pseudomonas benzenivorans]UTW07766.1 phosphohistidine phosphatase SixA [Pseudomonas benzenivorans]
MRLWLLRHGEAQAQAATDAERALTPRGCAEVTQVAVQLQGRPLTMLLVSPYVRTRQTAALVVEALGFAGPVQTVPWLTPDSDPLEVLRRLDRYDSGELLLVTHQPLVGALAGLLVHGHRQQPLAMHTASLAELEGDMLAAGIMDLLALVHPQ